MKILQILLALATLVIMSCSCSKNPEPPVVSNDETIEQPNTMLAYDETGREFTIFLNENHELIGMSNGHQPGGEPVHFAEENGAYVLPVNQLYEDKKLTVPLNLKIATEVLPGIDPKNNHSPDGGKDTFPPHEKEVSTEN